MLDILVTHYNEPSETVDRFLKSLAKQNYRDFTVTIVDDGMECPTLKDLNSYDFEVRHLRFPHKTVSKARNNAMDSTDSEFLMWCDCDDEFYDGNPNGLCEAMSRFDDPTVDIVCSNYLVECWKESSNPLSSLYTDIPNDSLILKKPETVNQSTIHGKIYRRSFLLDHSIRYDDDLWMNEDGLVNYLAYCISKLSENSKAVTIEEPFYIWKYNGTSTTRTNKLYPILGFDQFVNSNLKCISKLLSEFGKNEVTSQIFVDTLVQSYRWLCIFGDMHSGKEGYEENMKLAIDAVRNFITTFQNDFGFIITEDILNSSLTTIMKDASETKTYGKPTAIQWLKGIIST